MPNQNLSVKFETISVIGLGYIGLPTAAMFASRKIQVVGIDVDPNVVNTINSGAIHIVEPDLDMVVSAGVTEGYLRATLTPEPADAFLLAVPTPLRGVENKPDISYVRTAALSIAPVLKSGDLVILESTSPVGTTLAMSNWLADARPDLKFPQTHGSDSDIHIAYCPERVLPGRVMQELVTNDRVIGGMSERSAELASTLYKSFVMGDCITATGPSVAEMAKLTENSFRDVNIAFANELSVICDHLGINVWELIQLSNRHPRVNILQPGPGVGGHCIAVDPWFIVSSAPDQARLIRTARIVNDDKPDWVVEKVQAAMGHVLSEQAGRTADQITIAIYGLVFKPDIDDLRQSPALSIAETLLHAHPGSVLLVEPFIETLPTNLQNGRLATIEVAQAQADIHVMLVDHSAFKNKGAPTSGLIVDARGVWAP